MYEQLLVPVSLDDRDSGPLGAAEALARAGLCRRLAVVHVTERSRTRVGAAAPPRPEAFDRLVQEFAERCPTADVRGLHAVGRAVDEITRAHVDLGADLLVIGRARADRPGVAWGDHGQRLLRLCDGPVLVIPEATPFRLGRAVVGMDFSDSAVGALEAAAALFSAVEAVSVVDREGEGLDDGAYAEVVAATRQRYAERVGPAFPEGPPPLQVVDGASPSDALLVQALDADAVVIGSRGLTPLAAVLLGTTAERLGGRSDRPVLVHRKKGEHQGLFRALFRS